MSSIELDAVDCVLGSGSAAVHAVRDASLQIDQGQVSLLSGRSGAGKSTLLHVIGLISRPSSGTYRLNGILTERVDEDGLARMRATTIGYVFQDFLLLEDRSALENVAMPLEYGDAGRADDPMRLLEELGLADRASHRPAQLSGGERQRVAIARALVRRPSLIVADEPTGSLDSVTAATVADALTGAVRRRNATLVVASHDIELFGPLADLHVTMADGRLSTPAAALP